MVKKSIPKSQRGEALFASLLLFSFFLPWIYSMGTPIAGYQIRERLGSAHHLVSAFSSGTRVSKDYQFTLGLYAIPLCAILLLAFLFIRRYQAWMGVLAGAITLFAFIFLKGEMANFPFHRLAPGAYLALVAGIGLALTPLFRFK
jgi:hypothetical protein